MVERRLKLTTARLNGLREELRVIDEQVAHLDEDADDMGIRSLVSDNTGDAYAYKNARASAEAMAKHRAHVVSQIVELEQRQNELLDRLIG